MNKVIAFFLMLVIAFGIQSTSAQDVSTTIDIDDEPTYVLYYFYNRIRCATCVKFEKMVKGIEASELSDLVKSGKLIVKLVNTDEADNAHYLKDYSLFTKSIVISEVKRGKEIRWKNFDKIWTLSSNVAGLKSYVVKGTRTFIDPK